MIILATYIGYKLWQENHHSAHWSLEKKMYLYKQTDDLQHKSFCSCSLISVASEISIVSWFEKCCQLLRLYADCIQNWSLWRKELIVLKKKKNKKSVFLGTRADKASKQSEPNSKFIDVNKFLSIDLCNFWTKS